MTTRITCRFCGAVVHRISHHGRAMQGSREYHDKVLRQEELRRLAHGVSADPDLALTVIANHAAQHGREFRRIA